VTREFDPHEASRRGVEMRRARAEYKKSLREGRYRLLEVFDQAEDRHADPVLRGLRVEWFLRSIPGFGEKKTGALLSELGISPTATLGGLRVRQRAALRVEVARLYRRYCADKRGILLVLAGPSGVGKGTIVSFITSRYSEFVVSISATTRPQRRDEREGEHYFFLSERAFAQLVDGGELLEWALVHGKHFYGTPLGPVDDILDSGRHVILEIDVQGAKQVRRKVKRSMSVFIAPPTFDVLEDRLIKRGTEDEKERTRRLRTAKRELARVSEFDYVVINETVEEAAQSIVDLVLGPKNLEPTKE
jgi:guanylate kinase